MVKVPELFANYVSSFAGCMGGNPDAPIWLVCDHAHQCDLPMDPKVAFANPQNDMNALTRALPSTCKCSGSVARLINSIVGNEEGEINKVFKPEGQEKDQPIFLMAASPVCIGLIEPQAWIEKPAVKTDDGVVTMAKYTGLPTYKDFINYLVAERGPVFQKAIAEKGPKIILCQGFMKANEYFKLFGADRTSVQANDFFLVAPVKDENGKVVSLVFVTEMLGFGAPDPTTEQQLELLQAGMEFRHYAYDQFGEGWLGKYAGELLTLGKK